MKAWRIPMRDGGEPVVMRQGPELVLHRCEICAHERLCRELWVRAWKSAADSRYICSDCWPQLKAEPVK